MRLRRVVACLLLVLLLLGLTGCWDRSELEENSFVLAVGIDKGKQSPFLITFAIAIPGKMAGGGGGGGGGNGGGGDKKKDEKPYFLTSIEAPTITAALSMMDGYVDRRLSLLQTKAVFLGEDVARTSGLQTMDELTRFRQTRRTMFYIVTKGNAGDFLDRIEVKLEKDPNRFLEQLTNNYRITGMIPDASQIQNLMTTVRTGYAQPIAYYVALREDVKEIPPTGGATKTEGAFLAGDLPRKGGPNLEMVGAAAFLDDKMVGVLSGDEMRAILMLQGRFRRGLFSVPDPRAPDRYVSLDLREGRPFQLKVDLSGDRPHLMGQVTLEGELVGIQSGIDYTTPEMQRLLNDAIRAHITEQIDRTIRKTQEWGTDVAGFGRHVVKSFPTVSAWEAYGWRNRYKDAQVQVAVKLTLRRFGTSFGPPESRG